MTKFKTLVKYLGPGLLFASMAIGTSHLVLSTKAGAQYGWVMIIPIVLANVLKYPFFEFGIRYTTVTQKSLIEGYLNMGRGYLWVYAFVTLVSTFTILAALYIVTTGLFMNLFQLSTLNIGLVSLGLFAFISGILIIGRYKFLEDSLKAVITVLFIALLITTFLVIQKGPVSPIANYQAPEIFNEVGILFLISLMGWMPTAVEASGWVSLWSIENQSTQRDKPSLKIALQEFNLGYVLTGVLAIFFLIIGWLTLYGTGTELSGSAVVFADQVITLFTSHIGGWTYSLIAIAAFATMFSTCMTAHDAVTRVSIDVLKKLAPSNNTFKSKSSFTVGIILLALVNWTVIIAFGSNMGDLVALATFVSFVMAPIVGWMNLKAVKSKEMPKKHHPRTGLKILTYSGILFLSLFAIYYCWLIVN
ncbi:NRAMP family divalent metal transporter [Flagellimonas meridianipacifica]|uniref:Mn2+/Fe2+ NRAMP family transporter n=1 Tax=Flagellimonas meridianipacifica TaxID=1080225 RepID=A0A2T0MJJ2_9FLAO|nr:divalent metal cation transporter [Allomuricauda pacifica]PRX57760.1 Mn2+/Fe2+ NRAMP family transporter [Allomuricauda pacifica]